MKRSMMQAYVIKSDEAVTLYQQAFDAVLISSYANGDGTFFHSALDIQGEILAVSERNSFYALAGETVKGLQRGSLTACGGNHILYGCRH